MGFPYCVAMETGATVAGRIESLKRAVLLDGRDLLDLSMINPDILPSTFVIDKLHEHTIKPFNHRYSVARGIKKLREGFSDKYKRRFDVTIDPNSQVCAVNGTKDAIIHTLLASTAPGDSILVGAPTYPIYPTAAAFARLNVHTFDIQTDEDKMCDSIVDRARAIKAKVILLNFPNNPTGMTVTKGFFERLISSLAETNAIVINDFVYGEMGFSAEPVSLLSVRRSCLRLIETYSMSKAYSIPGWRVGAVCGDKNIVQAVANLKAKSDYGLFIPLQLAAGSLLSGNRDLVEPVRTQYRRRIALSVSELGNLGFEVRTPEGGASVWARLPSRLREMGSEKFCVDLLEREGIALLPGTTFGEKYREYLRIAMVATEEKLADMFSRMHKLLMES